MDSDRKCTIAICGDSRVVVINDKVFNESSNVISNIEKGINNIDAIINILDQKVKLRITNLIDHQESIDNDTIYRVFNQIKAIIICYDSMKKKSFDNIWNRWVDEIKSHMNDTYLYLVDMNVAQNQTQNEYINHAEILVNEFNAIYVKYFKLSTNLKDMMKDLIKDIFITKEYKNCYFDNNEGQIRVDMTFIKVKKLVLEKIKKGDQFAGQVLKRYKNEIIKNGVYFTADYTRGNLFDIDHEDDNQLQDIVSTVFDNIIACDITLPAEKKLIDKLIESSHKFKKECRVKWFEKRYALNLIDDYRLYAICVKNVPKVCCKFGKPVLDEFISNSHPYQLWNKFST
eukprot:419485_1